MRETQQPPGWPPVTTSLHEPASRCVQLYRRVLCSKRPSKARIAPEASPRVQTAPHPVPGFALPALPARMMPTAGPTAPFRMTKLPCSC